MLCATVAANSRENHQAKTRQTHAGLAIDYNQCPEGENKKTKESHDRILM